MKILIFSDTHGDWKKMSDALRKHPDAEILVHCGDGERQSEEMAFKYRDKMTVRVCGNCDLGSMLHTEEIFTVNGKKIMVTHGHFYDVKFGLGALRRAAAEKGVDIVFFGHTHIPVNEYSDGIYLFNPGHCSGWHATYGVAEIPESGHPLLSHAKI